MDVLQFLGTVGTALLVPAVLVAVVGYLTTRRQLKAERENNLQASKDSFANRQRAVYEECLTYLDTHPGEQDSSELKEWKQGFRKEYVKLVAVSGRCVFDRYVLKSNFADPKPLVDLSERKELIAAMHKDLFPREYGPVSWLRRFLGQR